MKAFAIVALGVVLAVVGYRWHRQRDLGRAYTALLCETEFVEVSLEDQPAAGPRPTDPAAVLQAAGEFVAAIGRDTARMSTWSNEHVPAPLLSKLRIGKSDLALGVAEKGLQNGWVGAQTRCPTKVHDADPRRVLMLVALTFGMRS